MAQIKLLTRINAPIATCFDFARSIDLHKQTMQDTNEEAIAGTTSGLIGLNETVTWRAKHFGVVMEMTSKITELMFATSFTDEQLKGPFKKLKHRHIFQYIDEQCTLMLDEFEFASPLGWLGLLVDKAVMKSYLTRVLMKRNEKIKHAAENSILI